MKRIAVVLFNLGGPDSLDAVRPFLVNLFSDPAIIRLPGVFRWGIARLIAARRTPVAREIYEKLGGRSPILAETEAQARALEAALADLGEVKVFIAMRYWHPRAAETVLAVKEFRPEATVLLPLYPQFSTTTTGSSLAEWGRLAEMANTSAISNYPDEPGFVGAVRELIERSLAEIGRSEDVRILFSAHGLPQSVVDGGDPYPKEVETSVRAVLRALPRQPLDWAICYQSRVGPLKWLEPSIEAELRRAAEDRKGVLIVPIAFVSEHSETLVELDIEYRRLAESLALPVYKRVPTVGTNQSFIDGLARLVGRALAET